MPLALPSFYDSTPEDTQARTALLMKQGKLAQAAGTAIRGTVGNVLGTAAAPLRAAVPAVGSFMSGLTGDNGLPTIPSSTVNAVAGPSANQNTSEVGGNTPQPPASPSPNAPPPTAQTWDQPAGGTTPTATTSVPGIQRYDTPGESPLYTNLPQSDFANKRSPDSALASVPGFLNTVKDYTGSNPPAGGDPSNGMFAPGIDSGLATIMSRAQSLLGSNSIVDNWRGRQLAKMHDRLLQGSVAQANAATGRMSVGVQAGHLANEMPIAQMHNVTALRGQDASVFPHLGMAGIQNMALKRLQAGGPDAVEEARRIAEIGVPRFAPLSRPLQKVVGPDGTVSFHDPNSGEMVSQQTPAEAQAIAKKRMQDAAATQLGLVKPDGR